MPRSGGASKIERVVRDPFVETGNPIGHLLFRKRDAAKERTDGIARANRGPLNRRQADESVFVSLMPLRAGKGPLRSRS